jgi:hypothetical protein
VPAATSYPHIALIEGVGGWTLGLGGLGEGLGGFGLRTRTFAAFGGDTCDSEPMAHCTGVRGPSRSRLSRLSVYSQFILCFAFLLCLRLQLGCSGVVLPHSTRDRIKRTPSEHLQARGKHERPAQEIQADSHTSGAGVGQGDRRQ